MAAESLAGAIGHEAAATAAGEIAKGATTALVKGFVEKVVTPYFSGKRAKTKMVNGTRKYARNIEFRTRCVPTIAVSGGAFVLDEVYEPLHLVPSGSDKSIKVDGYPTKLFNENRCVVVVDAAGMGKSTLTKYVIRRCLSEYKKIPLLVELRRLRQGQSIIQFICHEILGGEKSESVLDDFRSSLNEGNFLFLLDGYDEVDPEMREDVSAEISRISTELQYCNFWLTSRPDPALSSFSEFNAFEIAKLSFEQACALLRRYDKGRGLAPTLIDKLGALTQVHEFLGNPLLVTLLYKAFDYKATIPIKRNIFFRQVFEALYQDHDLSKEGAFERRKRSNLDVDEFHRFMRALGFVTFKTGRVQYSQVEFTSVLQEAIERSQLSADAAKIKSDLLSAVPIFVRDGTEVRWSHKAFQDYFASQFIYYDSGQVRNEIIERLFFNDSIERYENILYMLGELDLGLIRECCILPFLDRLDAFDSGEESELKSVSNYLDLIISVYALRYAPQGKRKDSHVSAVLAELKRSYDDVEIDAFVRMTLSMKKEMTLVGLMKGDASTCQVIAKIDPITFPFGRGKSLINSDVGTVLTNGALCLNKHVKECADPKLARDILEVIAYMAGVSAPTLASVANLRADVERRSNTHATASLLEGL